MNDNERKTLSEMEQNELSKSGKDVARIVSNVPSDSTHTITIQN